MCARGGSTVRVGHEVVYVRRGEERCTAVGKGAGVSDCRWMAQIGYQHFALLLRWWHEGKKHRTHASNCHCNTNTNTRDEGTHHAVSIDVGCNVLHLSHILVVEWISRQ